MTYPKTARATDLERLDRLDIFSWLAQPELKLLSASFAKSNYDRDELIFCGPTDASQARILIAGIARITCLNADNRRVTVALIPPGPIPELPSLHMSRFDFRCEAHSESRVCALDWKGFDRISQNGSETAFRKFHQNDLKHWSRLFRHTCGLLNELHERVAIAMLDLCDDFGIEDSRGTLLTIPVSHKIIASLVGATRPRVTEHLAQMERDRLILRQGRQFIVNVARLSGSLAGSRDRRLAPPSTRWGARSSPAFQPRASISRGDKRGGSNRTESAPARPEARVAEL
jgi:CRP-like cAMP-binding protein